MAAVDEEVRVRVTVSGVDQGARQFQNFQQTTTRAMSDSEAAVTRSLKNMASQFIGLAAAARAIKEVSTSGIEFNKFVENTTMSFTVMMKSAEKAQTQMKDLYNFAVNSPLTFKETAASSKQLMAYGFAAQELIPTMKTLGSVAIATGHSLDDIAYVYGTLKSQGRAYSRDLMQFGMRGIPIYEELAKVMGVNVKQIQKMASEGKIGFAEVEQAFQNMTTGSGRFSGVIEGFMETLTGKLSMLGDIAEQSSGKLMSGVTDSLKTFVDQMTVSLSSGGMQSFISDMSDVLGVLASVLLTVVTALATILPIVGKIMKALVPAAGVLLFLKLITTIPAVLMALGAAASAAAVSITAASTQMAMGAAAASAMAFGTNSAAAGVTALSASLKALAIANPWLLPLIGIAAVGGAVITIMSGIAAENRASPNENVRAKQLEKDFTRNEDAQGPNAGMNERPAWLSAAEVKKLAEQYQLAEGTTAKILMNTGALSAETWKQYLNTKSVTLALQEQDKIAKGLKHTSLTIEQEQAKYFAGITGYSMERYYDPDDTTAFGRRAANDYIAAVQATTQQQKDLLGSAFMPEDSKKLLEDELKSVTDKLQATLSSGLGMADLEKSGYLQGLRDYIEKLQVQLDGFGKKGKKLQEFGTWWAPIIQAAKMTATAMDDIQVATDQTIESAKLEYEKRRESLTAELETLEKQEARDAVTKEILALEATYLQYQKDITKEFIKQQDLKSFEYATGGNEAYWTNRQSQQGARLSVANNASMTAGSRLSNGDVGGAIASAMRSIAQSIPAAIGAGVDMLTKGTEVGNVASGDMGLPGVVMQATSAFINMISSIENVGKVLNPFATLFESTKTLLEPLLNNALQPLVQILTQMGTVVAQLLLPFVTLIKIVSVISYVILTPLIGVLNILGEAFRWLYDTIIVPVGNGIINFINTVIIGAINGFITAINTALGWLGVHIATVEYIDGLKSTTDALSDMSDAIDNQKSALDKTIDYLTKKINDAVDSQISSLSDLYEVGAITAASYSKQVKELNKQKINSDDVLVSAADKAITDVGQMYNRLYQLYDVKEQLNNENLTETQVSKILTDAGLSSQSMETAMKNAVLAALTDYGAAHTAESIKREVDKSVYDKKVADAQAVVDNALAQMERFNGAIAHDQSLINVSGGFNIGARVDQRTHTQELHNWYDVYVQAMAELDKIKSAGFAIGTANVPRDMVAQIHKGEGIVPSSFMDSIRSGELTLSGGKNEGSGQTVIVNVTVAGSVQAENDLANTIATAITRQKGRGLITVSA